MRLNPAPVSGGSGPDRRKAAGQSVPGDDEIRRACGSPAARLIPRSIRMTQPFKDAIGLCKTIMRNGNEAYVINSRLQQQLQGQREAEVDIATDISQEELFRLFPNAEAVQDEAVLGMVNEGGTLFRFYATRVLETAYPEATVARMTPRLLRKIVESGELPGSVACPFIPSSADVHTGFADMSGGVIRFDDDPEEALRRNYLLGIRALRFAANYHATIGPNTWLAIVRNSRRILDYVSITDIMDEWRKVEAENLHTFVKLLFDSMILHGLVPELAALSRLEARRTEEDEPVSVLDFAFDIMRHYPEQLPYDWYGTMACLFLGVGKLYTAEYATGEWDFSQYHLVGAKVTRKILNRLRLDPGEIDLVCSLVRNHTRLHYMLTDKGIRRFHAQEEYLRLIEIARAEVTARGGNFTEFNHNMKLLERVDTPEQMLEPLLNGNEIMEFTGLKPGPSVGIIRQALLKAQIAGEVSTIPEAVDFVIHHAKEYKPGE